MTPALTPAVALDYLHELSTDVRAGVVLSPDGALLAGPEAMAAPARALLAAASEAAEVHVDLPDGAVLATRSPRHALVVACGPFTLPGLARHDLGIVLRELDGEPEGGPEPAPTGLRAS